jgi:hypothetical protein
VIDHGACLENFQRECRHKRVGQAFYGRKLMDRGKNQQQTIVAAARELLGFIWAIGVQVEARMQAWPSAPAPHTDTKKNLRRGRKSQDKKFQERENAQ